MIEKILKKNNTKSSRHRLIFILFGAFIILIIYFLTNAYHHMLRQYKEEVLAKLKAVTSTGALMINGDLHAQLSNNYMTKDSINDNSQDPLYYRLHKALLAIKISNQLSSDVYTIVYYERDSTFHFIGTSAENPYFRHTYKNYPKDLLSSYSKGGTLDIYEDENGIWLSAFAPIRNSKGQVVALLEADEHFEVFLEKAREELIQNILFSLSITLPFAIVLFGYVANSLNKLRDIQVQLEKQNEEIKSQNEEIRSQSEQIERYNQELNEKITERTAALAKSHQQLSNFLYHSSHDVQAPVATLKGLLRLAKLDQQDKKSNQYFEMMQETTIHLEEMTKTIQLVYEIKSRELILEKVNLKTFLETNIITIINNGEKVAVGISGDDDIFINTDVDLLKTAIKELARNSIQYHNNEDKCTLQFNILKNNQWLHLEVEDNGDGIDPEKQPNLFNLFNRGHENSTGTGLGLYIAKTCVERLQGTISFLPKTKKGTKFLLRLPL